MFEPNYDRSKLINVQHIRLLRIEPPRFEQKKWTVVADLTYGTEIMLAAETEDDCRYYMQYFYKSH